jgi:hypothetical protein
MDFKSNIYDFEIMKYWLLTAYWLLHNRYRNNNMLLFYNFSNCIVPHFKAFKKNI